jgi:hypothetical protein
MDDDLVFVHEAATDEAGGERRPAPISMSPLKSRRSSSRIVSGSPLVRRQPGVDAGFGRSKSLVEPGEELVVVDRLIERVIRRLDIAVERDVISGADTAARARRSSTSTSRSTPGQRSDEC